MQEISALRLPVSHFQRLAGICRVALAACSLLAVPVATGAEVGETQVLKWKDGKKAVFLLAFDDSCPTHLTNVIPELEKRGMVGNFYIIPGKGTLPPNKAKWDKAALSPSVALQNHTFTHGGAKTVPQLDEEFTKANEAIKAFTPDKKWPRLIGYGKPGGVPWEVSPEDVGTLLLKHNLVERPPFWGPPIHQKSAAECVATIDKALQKEEMGHLDMHGVGGDWLVTPLDWFTAILDKLEAEKENIWVADVVHYVQYKKERASAEVKVLQTVPRGIRLSLTTKEDPALYDFPLTLETSVPADWKECTVKQGAAEKVVPVKEGLVRYDAVPGSEEIRLMAK